MGCNAGPTLNWSLVDEPTSSASARNLYIPWYQVHRRQVLNECWPAPAMVVEVIHVEGIKILAHEEDQCTDFCL